MEYLAPRVYHILSNKGTEKNLPYDVWHKKAWTEVTSGYIVKAARTATKTLNIQERGINPGMIGTHSLQSGGSMALKSWDIRIPISQMVNVYLQQNFKTIEWSRTKYEHPHPV